MAWLQCTSCNDLNYRTEIKVVGGAPKLFGLADNTCRRQRVGLHNPE